MSDVDAYRYRYRVAAVLVRTEGPKGVRHFETHRAALNEESIEGVRNYMMTHALLGNLKGEIIHG